jgi:1-acyl-sn-glycerol-3-phosphate acyltransferase
VKQLEYPMSLLSRGWSILIYPEGGRSKSGQIARFKAGPAIMAMQAKVPVIPVYMEGLRAVMPKGQREPRPAPVSARIGKPISLANASSVAEATAMLENAMRELAGQPPHHAPVPAPAPVEAEAAPAPAGGG